ncbi:unnamed protein product [Choristocarpus tenellus]
MKSFSSLWGSERRDATPNTISDEIQGHHRIWYRLAYGQVPESCNVRGLGLTTPMNEGDVVLNSQIEHDYIISSQSCPRLEAENSTASLGLERISSISYANAGEVVLNSPGSDCEETRKKDQSFLYQEDVLPDSAPSFLFHPYDKRKLVWDVWVAVLIVYSCVSIPFRIGFEVEGSTGSLVVDVIVDIMFLADVVVATRTAYVSDDGQVVVDSCKIIGRYFRGWVLRLLRLVRLLKLSRPIGAKEDNVGEFLHPSFWSIIKMLVTLFFIAHIMGCMWHWLAVLR